jgi:peptide/nickel transport system substrate-binding protein
MAGLVHGSRHVPSAFWRLVMQKVLASALAVLTFVGTACAPSAPQPAPTGGNAPPPGPTAEKRAATQVLTVAKVGLPGAVTPEISSSNNEIFAQIFDTLLVFGKNFEIKPWVAEKWEFRPTENSWRFAIRKDLTFSNGDKLTADDVVFSLNLMVDKKLPTATLFPLVTNAKKVDDYTVDIVSKQNDVSVLNGAPWMSILPATYYQSVGAQQFGVKPVGSGPYVLSEFKSADTIAFMLRPEPHPFRKPTFTEIRFRAVPELSQQVAGLRTGDIDFVQGTLTADQADQLKSSGFPVRSELTGNNSFLFSQPEAAARGTPLTDKRVRIALNYAINKDAIAKNLYKGYAQATGQLGIPASPFWLPDNKPYPYDVAMAKKLLADAGYPNGFKLPVGITFTPTGANADTVVATQSDLRAVGVESDAKGFEFATFLDQYYGRNGQQKGDLFLQGLGDQNGFFSQGRGLYDCNKQGYEIWWCNRQFNQLWDEAITEPDAAKRTDLLRRANAAFLEDVPDIFLVVTPAFEVHNPKLRGFDWNGTSIYTFDDAYKVE